MAAKVEPFYRAFGQELRKVRERSGLSQAELASRLSPPVTRAAIANMENAKQRVLAHTLVDLAATLRVEVSELIPKESVSAVQHPSSLTRQVAEELVRELGQTEGTALVAKLAAVSRRRKSA